MKEEKRAKVQGRTESSQSWGEERKEGCIEVYKTDTAATPIVGCFDQMCTEKYRGKYSANCSMKKRYQSRGGKKKPATLGGE